MLKVDELDLKILKMLDEDGRAAFTSIAKRLKSGRGMEEL